MPVITFSLPQSSYESLASKALDDSESPNLVAKRLILGFLGDNNQLSLDDSSKLLSRIETLESRLDGGLEGTVLDSNLDESSKVLERIKSLESRLDDSLDDKRLDEAIANHPKFKEQEAQLKEVRNELSELKLAFTGLYIPIPTDIPENNQILESEKNLDKRIDNNSSENALEGALKEIQVVEVIEEVTPVADPINEDNPDTPMRDISETTDIQGFEGNRDDEVETAIANKDQKNLLSFPLIKNKEKIGKRDIIKKIQGNPDYYEWVKSKLEYFGKVKNDEKFTYSKLNKKQADQIIKEYCQL